MKFIVALAVLLLAAVVLAVQRPEPLAEDVVREMYFKFLHKYEKLYGANEVEERFAVFRKNVETARFYNAQHQSEVFGVTKYMDWTEEEFAGLMLLPNTVSAPENVERISVAVPNDVPATYDWREHGAVTPVKNQGACGSCWAFSATGNMEGQYFIKTGKLVSLSEQNLVDCDHECDPKDPQSCDAGCNGGLMWNAYNYVLKAGGIQSEQSYPYQGYDGKCSFDKTKVAANFTSWKMLPTNADELKAALIQYGPMAVALNANWLQFYVGGISDPFMCNPKGLNHGVLIVGYGTGSHLGKQVPYWIVKNSWGSGWGEHGYFRMIAGKDKCGIESVVSTIVA